MWNSTTAYSVGDMVIVNDVGLGSDKAIYIATQANTNLYPMDNVPTWIYVGGPAQASGISGQIQVSDGSGFATGNSEFTYDPSYHQFKIGSASMPVSIDHRGSFAAVGTAEWWASDGLVVMEHNSGGLMRLVVSHWVAYPMWGPMGIQRASGRQTVGISELLLILQMVLQVLR